MIRTGTTAFQDMYFFMEDAARAVAAAGLRAVLTYGFIDLGDAERREREIRATERFVAQVKSMDNPRIKGRSRAPCTLHGLAGRPQVARRIQRGGGDRDPHPPCRD